MEIKPGNAILSSLPFEERVRIEPSLELVHLERGRQLHRAHRAIDGVWFFEIGVAAEQLEVGRGRSAGIGIIGNEGFVGLPLASGAFQAPTSTVVVVPGSAWWMSPADFLRAIKSSLVFRDLCRKYQQLYSWQTAASTLADARASIEQRLGRWLLMCHDRIEGSHLGVTHDHLASVLGVRRPSVTIALHVLEGRGLIRSRRSDIEITDRPGLEAICDGFYGMPEIEYRELLSTKVPAPGTIRASRG